MLVRSVPLVVHLVAEEEVELSEGGEVEVETVGDQTDVVLATHSELSQIENTDI